MVTPTSSQITALKRLAEETLDLIYAECNKLLQVGQTAYRGTCKHHPSATFPLRATPLGASQDTSSHLHKNGQHTVDIIEVEFTQRDFEEHSSFTNTIVERVYEWAQQNSGHQLDPEKLESLAYKEARSWITDGFTEADYRTGWDCWNEGEHRCRHTYAQRDLESMAAESIVKIATYAGRG